MQSVAFGNKIAGCSRLRLNTAHRAQWYRHMAYLVEEAIPVFPSVWLRNRESSHSAAKGLATRNSLVEGRANTNYADYLSRVDDISAPNRFFITIFSGKTSSTVPRVLGYGSFVSIRPNGFRDFASFILRVCVALNIRTIFIHYLL